MATGALRWALLTGLYLVLAGGLQTSEIVAGLLAGCLAAAASLLLRHAAEQVFRLDAPWLRLAWRVARSLVRDVLRVGMALAKALVAGHAGKLVRQPFAGNGNDAAGAGRAALATLLASIAPNSYVVETGRTAFSLHRLADAPASPDRAWPI